MVVRVHPQEGRDPFKGLSAGSPCPSTVVHFWYTCWPCQTNRKPTRGRASILICEAFTAVFRLFPRDPNTKSMRGQRLTRHLEGLVPARACRFKSCLQHSPKCLFLGVCGLLPQTPAAFSLRIPLAVVTALSHVGRDSTLARGLIRWPDRSACVLGHHPVETGRANAVSDGHVAAKRSGCEWRRTCHLTRKLGVASLGRIIAGAGR